MRYFYMVLALGGAVAHVGYATKRARDARAATLPAGPAPAVPLPAGGTP